MSCLRVEQGRFGCFFCYYSYFFFYHYSYYCSYYSCSPRVWSAASGERTVSVWSVEGEERGQQLSLACNEGVQHFDLASEREEVSNGMGIVGEVVEVGGEHGNCRRSSRSRR